MGAVLDQAYGAGTTSADAFRRMVDHALWEHGHGGYSGTMAEKHEAVYCCQLPARFDPNRWDDLAQAWHDYKKYGTWEERKKVEAGPDDDEWKQRYGVWKTIKHRTDPRPKHLRNGEIASQLEKYWQYRDGDKWGPAACVRLNTQDERRYKKEHGLAGTHAKVFYFIGYCSS